MSVHPFISVVIPALNEASVIGDCLQALSKQSYPRDRYEIVVVDNGSSDRTADISLGLGAILLRETRRSAYAARNLAIRSTRGDYLAFTDADCVPAASWIEELIAEERRSATGVVAGFIEYAMRFDSLGNRMLIASRDRKVIRENVRFHHCAPTGNVLIRRGLLNRYGLFNELPSGSDIAMSRRLASNGCPPAFAERAVVTHQCDLTSREYFVRAFRESRGHVAHETVRRPIRRMIQEVSRIPWRPGLRSVHRVRFAVSERTPSPFFTTWIYMWCVRFAAYAGRIHGCWRQLQAGGPVNEAAIAGPVEPDPAAAARVASISMRATNPERSTPSIDATTAVG